MKLKSMIAIVTTILTFFLYMSYLETDVLRAIEKAGGFGTFLTAVRKAGLEDTFSNEGEYTLFVPTDDAFAGLAPETLENLLNDTELLKRTIFCTSVSENLDLPEIVGVVSLSTMGGTVLTLTSDGRFSFVDGAEIIRPGIKARNGSVNGIDRVLLPTR